MLPMAVSRYLSTSGHFRGSPLFLKLSLTILKFVTVMCPCSVECLSTPCSFASALASSFTPFVLALETTQCGQAHASVSLQTRCVIGTRPGGLCEGCIEQDRPEGKKSI
jgi:hypothetical protein